MFQQGFGFGGVFIRGLVVYTLVALFILNSGFCGGLMLTIFICVDFIWAIVVSLFLQKMNNNGAEVAAVAVTAVHANPYTAVSDVGLEVIVSEDDGNSARAIGEKTE